jgi:hypothetical protein
VLIGDQAVPDTFVDLADGTARVSIGAHDEMPVLSKRTGGRLPSAFKQFIEPLGINSSIEVEARPHRPRCCEHPIGSQLQHHQPSAVPQPWTLAINDKCPRRSDTQSYGFAGLGPRARDLKR